MKSAGWDRCTPRRCASRSDLRVRSRGPSGDRASCPGRKLDVKHGDPGSGCPRQPGVRSSLGKGFRAASYELWAAQEGVKGGRRASNTCHRSQRGSCCLYACHQETSRMSSSSARAGFGAGSDQSWLPGPRHGLRAARDSWSRSGADGVLGGGSMAKGQGSIRRCTGASAPLDSSDAIVWGLGDHVCGGGRSYESRISRAEGSVEVW